MYVFAIMMAFLGTSYGILLPVPAETPEVKKCGCYKLESGQTVIIKSTNHPNDYGADEFCSWCFHCESKVESDLTLTCDSFELEADCALDFLHVQYDSTKQRYCGTTGPSVSSTNENCMQLVFQTDNANHFKGFECKISCKPKYCKRYYYLGIFPLAYNKICI